MNDIFEQLVSSAKQNAPQPELLEALGKKAAAQFLQNGDVLNETIVKLASEYPNIGNEHVKRIAEFANNAVFQGLHSQNEDKNVHFPLADPGAIIQDLRDGGSPSHDGKTLNTGLPQNNRSFMPPSNGLGDYQTPPSAPAPMPSAMSGMGNVDPMAKEASVSWSGSHHANPVEDVFDAHIRLRATREKLAEAHENFDLALKNAKEDFYQNIKRACLDPDSPGLMSIVNAVKLAAPNDSFAFQVLRPVSERLVLEGALKTADIQKTASQKIVNPYHPIMVSFAGIMKMAEEKVRSRAALNDTDKAMEKTAAFLRKHVQ